MDIPSFFQFQLHLEEVRLSPSEACRAWTVAHECFSAFEWNSEVASLPYYRQIFETARLHISEVLSVDGVDPMGLLRKLLIHETTASLSRSWLREVGFVHLEAASGIHLYCLWRSLGGVLRPLSERSRISLRMVRSLRMALPLLVWFVIWALAGFRPGLLRPVVLVTFRWVSDRFGVKWKRSVPILAALSVDACFGFLKSYGSTQTFTDWAPGEMHYALSWWGGIYGYEWARARGLGTFRSHAALSFFSWLGVLPLELWEGRFAIWTPVLSLLTVEAFVRGGYAVMVTLALCVGLLGDSFYLGPLQAALQWLSLGWSLGIGGIAEVLTLLGAVRTF